MTGPMDLDHALDSKFAKTINRVVLPSLAVIAGTVVTWMVQDMRAESKEQSQTVNEMRTEFNAKLAKTDSKVDLLNAKVDTGVLWRISEIERRLQHVEQTTRTP